MLDAFTAAAIEACDELDGVKDGIISYPGRCNFDAASLVGKTITRIEPSSEVVITDKMAELVNGIWEGPSVVRPHPRDPAHWAIANYVLDCG